MSECPKCGEKDLTWTRTSKGKNWLKDENNKWHNCPVQQFKYGKIKGNHCPNCPRSWGWYVREKDFAGHKKIYHPNNETYDDNDIKKGEHLLREARLWASPPPPEWKMEQKHI